MNSHALIPSTQLRDIQEWFQAAVTCPEADPECEPKSTISGPANGHADVDRLLTRSTRLSAAERLAVYTNAYTARLIDCLTQMYPVLARTLGEEVFGEFALEYLKSHPSRSHTLSNLGKRFAGFLADNRPPRQSGEDLDWADFMVDLSRLEWDIYEIFDGAGMEEVTDTLEPVLLALPPEQWSTLRLVPAPCLRLVSARYPVNVYYTQARGLHEGEDVPGLPAPADEHLVLSRTDYCVRRYPMAETPFRVLQGLCEGQTIGQALTSVLAAVPAAETPTQADSVKTWFALWRRERFFANAQI